MNIIPHLACRLSVMLVMRYCFLKIVHISKQPQQVNAYVYHFSHNHEPAQIGSNFQLHSNALFCIFISLRSQVNIAYAKIVMLSWYMHNFVVIEKTVRLSCYMIISSWSKQQFCSLGMCETWVSSEHFSSVFVDENLNLGFDIRIVCSTSTKSNILFSYNVCKRLGS